MPFPKDPEGYIANVDMFGPGAWDQYKQSQSPQEVQRTQDYVSNVGGYTPPANAPQMGAIPEHLQGDEQDMFRNFDFDNPPPLEDLGRMMGERRDQEKRFTKQEWDALPPVDKLMEAISYVPDLLEPGAVSGASLLLGTPGQRQAATKVMKAFKNAKLPGEAGRGKFIGDLLDQLGLGTVLGNKPRITGARATFAGDVPIDDILDPSTATLRKDIASMEDAAYNRAYPDLDTAMIFERDAAETAADMAQREKHIPRLARHRERQLQQWGEAVTPEIATRPYLEQTERMSHELGHAGDLDIFQGGSRLPSNPKLSKAMKERGFTETISDTPTEQLSTLIQDLVSDKKKGVHNALSAEELNEIGFELGLDLNKLRGSVKP